MISPASPPDPHRLSVGKKLLEEQGYRVEFGPGASRRRGYLAGTDQERAEELHQAFQDMSVDAILVGRGGFGSGRVLSRLDRELIQSHPKPLVGYSDLTPLLLAIHRITGLITFHGPMVSVELGRQPGAEVLTSLWRALDGWYPESVQIPRGHRPRSLREGTGRGPLVGGCLSLLSSMVGTPWEPDLTGAILFWEEVGEDPYRIDRLLGHLKWAGWFENLAGMVIGRLVDCKPRDDEPSLTLEEVLEDHLSCYDFPILVDYPVGHVQDPVTLPIGVKAELDTREGGLRILEPAVEPPPRARRGLES